MIFQMGDFLTGGNGQPWKLHLGLIDLYITIGNFCYNLECRLLLAKKLLFSFVGLAYTDKWAAHEA